MGVSLETQAYEGIKQAILTKELKPGQEVSQNEWVERLNISRTPVRDALKRLEYEGFIIRETERQWHVFTLTLDDVYKLYDARESVEGYIARLAAKNLSSSQAAEIKDILIGMEIALGKKDHDEFDKHNQRFHALINASANNEYLIEIARQVNQKIHRLRPQGVHLEGRLQKSFEENSRIAMAMVEHNMEKAEQYQREHIQSSRDYLILLLKQIVIPFAGPVF